MNFEFLKNLRGLDGLYDNCSNAEKLARTMPVQSIFTSRKSAELLAKFIYMAACNQQMEEMTFADVLSDWTFKNFIRSRDVLDAFHYIRKQGNLAVHDENNDETVKDAIDVLRDLHYVAGETARTLGLIKRYPAFESNIDKYPNAVFRDDEEINKRAAQMFAEYVEDFNAQQERDMYIEERDYDVLRYSIESNIEMHEYLEFEYRPRQPELIEYLQKYLATLAYLSVTRAPDKAEELELFYPVTFDARLIIDGITYSSDQSEFIEAVTKKLPVANGFVLDITCNGNIRMLYHEELDENGNGRKNMIRKDSVWTGAGLFDTLSAFKRRCNFTYKLSMYYPDSGGFRYEKIFNGKEIDLLAAAKNDIVEKTFDDEWWSWNLVLWADVDYEKHPDVLKKLQDIVRESLPKSELPYCEDAWEDGDYHILCNSIQWNCMSLKEIQLFLDKLNVILLPYKESIEAGGEGTWEVRKEFAVATWDWTDSGFKVLGIQY